MVSKEECRKLIEEIEEDYKKFWLEQFTKHGYSKIEEDNNPEEWHDTLPDDHNLDWIAKGEERIAEKLIFWKKEGLDGIVMGKTERENEYNKKSYKTKFYAIGKARDYFNNLYKNQKESGLRKLLRFGKEKTLFFAWNKIKINEKEYDAQMIISEKGFENILMH